MTDLNGHTP
jgi:hypothetical protein